MQITPGVRVRDIHNPARVGTVTNTPPRQRPSGAQWQVRWDSGGISFEYEGSVDVVTSEAFEDPYTLVGQGKFGRSIDLRRNLTFVHLTGRLANIVYSMGVTNTDFYPHQYRPLLTLLESPGSGIVIADEVGLGKTIEAGLIWTEFRARYDRRKLLVVCPAMLREKWRDELQMRFGVTAQIVGAKELLDALKARPFTDAAWITSYQAVRPPKSWRPGQSSDQNNPPAATQLADFLHENADDHDLVDMVVFDEAHHMRNRETGAWRLGDLLRDVSHSQVMLSATPINLRNEDLFSLLVLIDPDHFSFPEDLNRLIAANLPLVQARDAALNLQSSAKAIIEPLELARRDDTLSSSAQLLSILDDPPTDEKLQSKRYRSELADSLERINLLAHILTRSRKRDVQTNRVHRRVYRQAVPMSAPERALYEAITQAIRSFALSRGVSAGFLLAMPQRQLCSSPAALLRSWMLTKDDPAEIEASANYSLEELEEIQSGSLKQYLRSVVPSQVDVDALMKHDTKLQHVVSLLKEIFEANPADKVILFTSFRATARYLAERFAEERIPSTIVWGNQDRPKHLVIDDFRTDKRLRVLISTEVAAEGVDLQFCRMLINYDLPWNPTRVEQRIGRIDRLGQASNEIFVWNLYFENTIDDRIVSRLLDRLRIFEEALGEAEAVVGETIAKLEFDLLCRPRTEAEEREAIDKAALALENVAKQREELERNAAHMMAHGQRILEKISAAQQLSRFVTEGDLFSFVQDYLERFAPGHDFRADDTEPMRVSIKLPPDMAAQFDVFLRQRGALAHTRLATGNPRRALFLNRVTERFRSDTEIIHQFHPLISFITEQLKSRDEQFYPVVAVRLRRSGVTCPLPTADLFAFHIDQWTFTGVRDEEWLAIAVVSVGTGETISEEAADVLLQAARLEGRDWLGATNDLDLNALGRALEAAESDVLKRFEHTFSRKRTENEDRARFQLDSIARFQERRLKALDAVEQQHRMNRRDSLVKATQGIRRVLLEKLDTRRAAVRERQEIRRESRFVCAGVIRLEADVHGE